MLKYITYRLAIIIFVIVGTHVIYDRFFFEADLLKHSEVINLVRDINPKTDILYIGESSNSSAHHDDIDQRKISEFISDFYPSLILDDITKPAAHARNYHLLLNQIPPNNQIKTIIVTLNLRSFGIPWIESDLETSLNKSMVLLEDGPSLYKRFRLAFKDYDNKTKKERLLTIKKHWKKDKLQLATPFKYNTVRLWDGHLFKTGILDNNGNRSQEKTQLACHFVKNYGFEIDTLTNPRIHDFNNIIKLAKTNNWNVVFNLLSENTERGHKLVGENWTHLVNKNTSLLVDYFTRKGAIVVNNLNAVPDSLFTDRDWTTEHYHEEGRQTIAKEVALSLKVLHNAHFKEHQYLSYKELMKNTLHYSHKMESTQQFWSAQNFTVEKAFSGNKSCKINKDNLYSATLNVPYALLNNDHKNAIHYSMDIMATDTNYNALLIIEIHDSINGNKSLTEPLTTFNVSNHWKKITHRFEIPHQYQNAETIKVFVYNPSSTNVYIDNVNITFE